MGRFTSFDGTEIHYHTWGDIGRGIPVVLQHGFIADGRTNWEGNGIVRALTEAGHTVIAPDARGHGQSGKPHDPAVYGESNMARDLQALFDHLQLSAVNLVGYSMGAIIALLTAIADQRVRRLVVGGVGAGIIELGGVDTRAIPNDLLAEALLAEDPGAIKHPGAAGFRLFADAMNADRRALAAQAQSVHAEPIPVDQIQVPALVLAGEQDPLAERPQVLAGALLLGELVVVPGDHMSALRQPAFVEALLRFLA